MAHWTGGCGEPDVADGREQVELHGEDDTRTIASQKSGMAMAALVPTVAARSASLPGPGAGHEAGGDADEQDDHQPADRHRERHREPHLSWLATELLADEGDAEVAVQGVDRASPSTGRRGAC